MLPECIAYGRIILIATPAFMLQNMFQSFLVTAEKPQIGLVVTIAAGVTNMILDALFIAVFDWGVEGAAIATALSQCVGGVIPLVYFAVKNTSCLKLTKTNFDGSVLFKTCTNGSSEFLTNISMSLVSMLYNIQLMKYAGEDGIAAYGVIMYVQFIFIAIFLGYSIGTAPIVGFDYGAENYDELKNIYSKSMKIILGAGTVLMTFALVFSGTLAKIFVGYDAELMALTARGFRFYAVSFLICGFSIYGSAFFTALNNGIVSAAISFLRTVVFQVAAVLILPIFWKIDGIWLSIIVAETASLTVTTFFLWKYKGKYGYK